MPIFKVKRNPASKINLKGYPLLVCAPQQWGDGIRTENNGTLVSVIFEKNKEVADVNELATFFRVTPEHIVQAIAYVSANPGTRA